MLVPFPSFFSPFLTLVLALVPVPLPPFYHLGRLVFSLALTSMQRGKFKCT
jgi:hypothetical protein